MTIFNLNNAFEEAKQLSFCLFYYIIDKLIKNTRIDKGNF